MSKPQIQSYLKFFASKRDVSVSEIDSLFQDAQEAKLTDDMFSKDEVTGVLNSLKSDIKACVRRELEKCARMSGVVLDRVLETAIASGVDVTVDMSRAEDEALLSKVGVSDLLSESDTKRLGSAVKLDSLRDEQARLMSEVTRLKDENAVLKDRYTSVQTRATHAVKDISDLNQEIARLTAELEREKFAPRSATVTTSDASKVSALESRVRSLEDQLATSEGTIKELRSQLSTASDSANVPVTQSKQFQQLKSMLDKKNAQLIDVRRRLAKYEPDDASTVDDDAPATK